MSDNPLKNAEILRETLARRIEELEAEIAKCREDIDRAERFMADYKVFLSIGAGQDEPVIHLETKSLGPRPRKRIRPKNPPKELVADVSIQIIRDRGEPVMRDQLYDALAERDVVIEGKDPQMVLSTMLWRQPEKIVRLKGGGYWPAEDELPKGEELATRSADA